MVDEKLDLELAEYTSEELQEIHDTQQDLYSAEELSYMEGLIEERKVQEQRAREEFEHKVEENLPEEIKCQKCGGPNEITRDTCKFCGVKLDKSEAYAAAKAELLDEDDDDEDDEYEVEEGEPKSFAFHYVISVLIPLIGFIMGGILLTKDDEESRSAGKVCIVAGLVAMVLSYFIWQMSIGMVVTGL